MKVKVNVLEVLEQIRSKRNPSYTTKADVLRLIQAREQDDYTAVHASRLYNKHSGEYCELYQIVYTAWSAQIRETYAKYLDHTQINRMKSFARYYENNLSGLVDSVWLSNGYYGLPCIGMLPTCKEGESHEGFIVYNKLTDSVEFVEN